MQRFVYAISVSTLVLFLASNAVAAPQRPEPVDLPLTFVPNRGQARADIVLLGQSAGFRVAFMRGHALFAFTKKEQGLALELDFVGARRGAVPEGRHVARRRASGFRGFPTRFYEPDMCIDLEIWRCCRERKTPKHRTSVFRTKSRDIFGQTKVCLRLLSPHRFYRNRNGRLK